MHAAAWGQRRFERNSKVFHGGCIACNPTQPQYGHGTHCASTAGGIAGAPALPVATSMSGMVRSGKMSCNGSCLITTADCLIGYHYRQGPHACSMHACMHRAYACMQHACRMHVACMQHACVPGESCTLCACGSPFSLKLPWHTNSRRLVLPLHRTKRFGPMCNLAP